MIIGYHKRFKKGIKSLPKSIQEKFFSKLDIFKEDPFSISLNNHALRGKYEGMRSINITSDLRALYEIKGNEVIFQYIDTHSNLYG